MKNFRETFLPYRIKKLSDIITKDVTFVCKKLKIEFDPKWYPVCRYLNDKTSAPINELAAALELTHPAIILFVNEMIETGILTSTKDNEDKRKRMVLLSGKGRDIFNSISPLFTDIEESIKELSRSAGYDILHFLDSLEKTLERKSLATLILEKNKKRLLDTVEILRYAPKYRNEFQQLNYEWLNKYFEIEEEDRNILSNPEKIISDGGEIFFARIKDAIAGTCAAIKLNKNTYELAKMAVSEKFQGMQAGKKLALSVIGFAYSQGAKSVILETSSKLYSAINLYESIGFKAIPGLSDSKYNRPLFQMKLELK
jgi:DNA-binding MarR family transcriptional regulator/predicted GNAT family N-acyltransferase